MATVSEIQKKYLGDVAGVTMTIDLNALRESALMYERDAKQMLDNANESAKEKARAKAQGAPMPYDDSAWRKRRVSSVKASIAEQRRTIGMAKKQLDECLGILDNAEAKLGEVK